MNTRNDVKFQTRLLSLLCLVLAGFTFLSPIWPGGDVASHVGGLTVWVGIIEIYHGFRRNKKWPRRNAMYSGAFSILIGVVLINTFYIQPAALKSIIGGVFFIEAIRYFRNHISLYLKTRREVSFDLLAAIGNTLLILGIFFFSGKGVMWAATLVMGLRMIGIALNILAASVGELDQVSEDVIRDLGYAEDSALAAIAQEIEEDEEKRAPYDRKWILLFIFLLFFIHLGVWGWTAVSWVCFRLWWQRLAIW
jgi:uncharacterized membrane protein HdeD (DUF308 family)